MPLNSYPVSTAGSVSSRLVVSGDSTRRNGINKGKKASLRRESFLVGQGAGPTRFPASCKALPGNIPRTGASDLFYRLNVFPIRIPPLRDRKEDIPLLVSYFVQKYAKQMQKKIESVPSVVMKGLTAREWPGSCACTTFSSRPSALGKLRRTVADHPGVDWFGQYQRRLLVLIRRTNRQSSTCPSFGSCSAIRCYVRS